MKNALLLPLRYIALLLTCAALFLLVQIGINAYPTLSWPERASIYLEKLFSSLPSIVLLTLFLSSFIPSRHKSNIWFSFLILFALTASGLFLSTAFYHIPPEGKFNAISTNSNQEKSSLSEINRMAGNKISINLNPNASLVADFSSKDGRILSLSTAEIQIKEEPTTTAPAPSFFERMERQVSALFTSPQNLFCLDSSWLKKAITALAFAFFLCSTSVFLRISDWKLFNAIFFLFVFWGGVSLAGIVYDGGFSSMVASLLPSGLGAYVPNGIIGFIGLCLFSLLGFLSPIEIRAGRGITMNRASKTFAFLIFALLGCFAVYLAIEFFILPERAVIPAYLPRWHSLRALDATIRMALPLTCVSTLLAFGLFKIKPDEHVVYSRFMQRMTVNVVILSSLYAIFILLGSPLLTQEIHRMERVSDAFKNRLAQTEEALSANDFAAANGYLRVAALISPKDPRYVAMRGAYIRKSAQVTAEKTAAGEALPVEGQKQAGELTATDLFTQAQRAYDSGDFYLAHSLATEASRIDRSRSDAQRLAALAWDRLSKMDTETSDDVKRKLAEEKRLAYTALQNGDPMKAYAAFLELSKTAPQDKDISRYLKESLAALKLISFSVDEVTRLSLFPQASSVLLRLSANKEGQTFLAAKDAYIGNEVIYLTKMEYLNTTNLGEIQTHISAPFAKIKNGRMILTGYDRENANKAYIASAISGQASPDLNYLELPIKTSKIAMAIRANESVKDLSITDLFSAIRDTEPFGVQMRPLRLEALKRICLSFNFLFFSLLSLYLGYRFKYQGKKSTIVRSLIVILPSFILISAALKAWDWFQGCVAAQLDASLGSFTGALFAFGGIQFLATVVAFVILAGYREKPSD